MLQFMFASWRSQSVPTPRSKEVVPAHTPAEDIGVPEKSDAASGVSSSSISSTSYFSRFTLRRRLVAPTQTLCLPPSPVVAPPQAALDASQIRAGDVIVVQDEKPISKTTWIRWIIRIGQRSVGLSENNRRVHISVVVSPRADEPADRLYIVEGDSPRAVRVPLSALIERERLSSTLMVYRFRSPLVAETISSVATIMQHDGTLYFEKRDFVRSAMKRAYPDTMSDHLPERANCSTLAAYAINIALTVEEDSTYLARETHGRARIPTSPQILSAAFDTGQLPCTLMGTIPRQTT